MKVKNIISLIKNTFSKWSEDKASRLAAALAYYTIFSIPPLLIISIAIAGLVFGQEAAESRIVAQFSSMIGADSAEALQTMIANERQPGESVAAAVFGVIILLFGASGVFGQLQDALNTIWGVAARPGRGILGMIKNRFFSFTMVLGISFLLLVSLMISTALGAVGEFVVALLPGLTILAQLLNLLISLTAVTVVFALIFKVVPDVKIAWGDVWIGAAVTAVLFVLGQFAIGLYLGNSDVTSTYGAAGALVIILLWVFYSAQIMFIGAEFTQVYANRYGKRIEPAENAVLITEEAREKQGIPSGEQVQPPQRTGEFDSLLNWLPVALVGVLCLGLVFIKRKST